jgi:hypothetical protein
MCLSAGSNGSKAISTSKMKEFPIWNREGFSSRILAALNLIEEHPSVTGIKLTCQETSTTLLE